MTTERKNDPIPEPQPEPEPQAGEGKSGLITSERLTPPPAEEE